MCDTFSSKSEKMVTNVHMEKNSIYSGWKYKVNSFSIRISEVWLVIDNEFTSLLSMAYFQ